MIITRTPYRISFFGGGTDYPAWFREHGGSVLSTTISRYCYLSCRWLPPFFNYRSRIVWSHIEHVNDHQDILHPVVRCALKEMDIQRGVEIHHNGDLPARTGLGSSSSFTVGLLLALNALKGQMVNKYTLAQNAIELEQEKLRENVGVQDQISAAFGGFNRVNIFCDGSFQVDPVVLPQERLNGLRNHLLMFYTGVSRSASAIAADKIKAIPSKTAELKRMQAMVGEALDILSVGDYRAFGELLHESWMLKRSLAAAVAPEYVDEIYTTARAAGAWGGKLLGAGGGGFMIFLATPERHAAIQKALETLLAVPVEFDRKGAEVILYDPVDAPG